MSEERLMPKMFDYQKEIVEDTTATTIIGNMSRGGGKDYILVCKVLYERPRISMYMAWSIAQFGSLQEKFEEIINTYKYIEEDIVYKNMSRDKIKIKFKNEDVIEIYSYNSLKREDELLTKNIDMMLYSDCLPQFDIKAKKHIAMVSISYTWLKAMYPCKSITVYNISLKQLVDNELMNKKWLDKCRQDVGQLNFRQELDLFEEYDSVFKNGGNELIEWLEISNDPKTLNNFVDASIMKLITEFNNIPQTEKTTMTRNSILDMISKLQLLKTK